MSTDPTSPQALLTQALHVAAEVLQARLQRSVTLVEQSRAPEGVLLRFDLAFETGGMLQWFISRDDATGFSDLLVSGAGDRAVELSDAHQDALSDACSNMLELCLASLNTSLTQPLANSSLDMAIAEQLPPAEALQLDATFEIEGFGPFTIVQQANAALMTLLTERSAAPDNVVPLPDFSQPQRGGSGSRDLSMLLNVPLEMTVELGRTERQVRQVLELQVGSILELNKLAGDPMDIYVNGKLLARGEVVVIDDDFGIRVTEIVTPEQRLRSLG